MIKSQGNAGVALLECLNPRKQTYVVRWAITPMKDDNGNDIDNSVEYMEEKFNHKPSLSEIKSIVLDWYNSEIDRKILEGFKYGNNAVWLSTENQFNYKAVHDLAIQTNGQNLPAIFKVGSEENPTYIQFNTVIEIQKFYLEAMKHIQKTVEDGWKTKDSINWDKYGVD